MNLQGSETGVFEAIGLPMQPVHRLLEEGTRSRVRREQEFSVNMSGNSDTMAYTCLLGGGDRRELAFCAWSGEEGCQCTVQYILLVLQVCVCLCGLCMSVCACECVCRVPVLAVLPGWVICGGSLCLPYYCGR